MAKLQAQVPAAPATAGNGATAAPTAAELGAAIWRDIVTPRDGLTFAERWAHQREYVIGAYGEYRVIVHCPPVITLVGKEAVAYRLGEIPQPTSETVASSYDEALHYASLPKPHNQRRNFGEELETAMVESFIAKHDPDPDGATRVEKSAKFNRWLEGFRSAEVDDQGQIDKVDAFLIAEATALRDSEDMRRKSKGKGAKAADTADTPKAPAVSTSDLLSRLTLVDKDGIIGDLKS